MAATAAPIGARTQSRRLVLWGPGYRRPAKDSQPSEYGSVPTTPAELRPQARLLRVPWLRLSIRPPGRRRHVGQSGDLFGGHHEDAIDAHDCQAQEQAAQSRGRGRPPDRCHVEVSPPRATSAARAAQARAETVARAKRRGREAAGASAAEWPARRAMRRTAACSVAAPELARRTPTRRPVLGARVYATEAVKRSHDEQPGRMVGEYAKRPGRSKRRESANDKRQRKSILWTAPSDGRESRW